MSEFYDIDSTKVTATEYLYESKILGFIGIALKYLRVKLPGSTDDPNVDTTLESLVETLPAHMLEQFQPAATALASLGFHSPVYQIIVDPGTHTTRYWATYLHESGIHYARIHYRFNERAPNPRRKPFIFFFTEFTDGSFIVSTNGKPDMLAPATIDLKHQTGAKPEAAWAWHQQRVATSGRENFAAVTNRDELLWSGERQHVQLRDFHLARGVFHPRSAAAKAKADAHLARIAEAKATGIEHPDVMAHVNDLQEKKPGWSNAFWVLLGSAVLFLAVGARYWDWKITLWLLPVLLFHEAGHWIAMRIFKYRNLRMFFIPLFGAAVTGQNWNVPGWKKAIVSLAGPLPGILLGCALAVVAFFINKPWLNQLSMILLVLNGINLLPFLPLDGGHILHTTLFCRNRWLDILFRVAAVLGLFGIMLIGSGRLMIPLIVIMTLALPVAFKLGKVTDDLRDQAPPPLPEDNDRIPPQTAQMIIAAVKEALPKNAGSKVVAQHTINVFETLNARPPGVLATLGILAVHGGAVFLALVFGVLLTVNMHGGLKDFFGAAIRQPRHAYVCGTSQTVNGRDAKESSAGLHNIIAVTLADETKAVATYNKLTKRVPANGKLTLFGESLLLSLPTSDDAAREKWFDEFHDLSTDAFVVVSNETVTISLDFIAPNLTEATNLVRALTDSLQGTAGMNLVMPWAPEANQPGFAAKLQARHEWRRISQATAGIWRHPDFKALNARIAAAAKRGARSESARLQDEHEKLTEKLRAQTLDDLRTNPTNRVDPELLTFYQQLIALDYTNRTERAALNRQVASKLGEIPYQGDEPAPEARAYCASYGSVSQHGLLIELNWVSLHDAAVGLPALTDWLCQKRCTTIKYEMQRGYGSDLFDGFDPGDEE